MNIGIRTGCLRTGWLDGLKTAAQLGFQSLEPDIGADYSAAPIWTPEDRQTLAAAAVEAGCALDSVCIGACWKISPASADARVREEAATLMADTARSVAELGVRWILVPITPGGEGVTYDESVQRWIEAVKAAAPAAEESGVVFCLENVGRGCGRSAEELTRLVDAVGSPAVKVYYDIGNAVLFGFDPVEEIRALAERIAIVHIKDHADRLGDGDVPVPACIRALRDIGYHGNFVFETNPTADPQRAATYNLGFFKGILAAVDR